MRARPAIRHHTIPTLGVIIIAALSISWLPTSPGTQVAAQAETTQPELLQFTSGEHVLAFAPDKAVLAGMDHALTVEFVGSQAVIPHGVAAPTENEGSQGMGQAAPLGTVTYLELWPGIDLRYQAAENGVVESAYHIAPGADPSQIGLRYNAPLEIDPNGNLSFTFESGQMTASAPIAWQEIDGKWIPVDVEFKLTRSQFTISFSLGAYNPAYPLTIDPTYTWHTFYGSGSDDLGLAIALDGSGNIFVAGGSGDTWVGPGGQAPRNPHAGNDDITVIKLDGNGAYQWHTFYGSGNHDDGRAIALDGSGNIFVAGYSRATWNGPGPTLPLNAHAGNSDITVLKLDGDGAYQWHSFYGSGNNDEGHAIALDGSGSIIVAGQSGASWDGPGPTLPLNGYAGLSDITVLKLDGDGAYQWHTFYGSGNHDQGFGLALDGSGNIVVAGGSNATWDGPGGQTPLNTHVGNYDISVLKLNSDGAYQWHTFYGSGSGDDGRAVALDGSGNILLTGQSEATWDGPGPTPPLNANSGGWDINVVKLDSDGAYQWHTFYGSGNLDAGRAITMDGSGNILLTGFSAATWDGPGAAAPLNTHTGAWDISVVKMYDPPPTAAADEEGKEKDKNTKVCPVDSSGTTCKIGHLKVVVEPNTVADAACQIEIEEIDRSNFQLGERVFDVKVICGGEELTYFQPRLKVCIRPSNAQLRDSGYSFYNMSIYHRRNGQWSAYTYPTAFSENEYLCLRVSVLSEFALVVPQLPETGFTPGVVTALEAQPAEKNYACLDDMQSTSEGSHLSSGAPLGSPAEDDCHQDSEGTFTLEIPTLDLELPIVGVPLTEDGWDVSWLGNSAGWLQGTAYPTWSGNTALTAHVWNADNSPGPFVDLHTLQHGDEIIIQAWGLTHTYEVRQVMQVRPDDLRALPHDDYDVLTLITCQGYDQSSREYGWRLAVRAVLVNVE